MAINYAKTFNRRVTPQSQPIPGSSQVPNSGGGYSWQVDDWMRLDRFLVLGAEGGTYYIAERDLVKENHDAILRCIKADGVRAVTCAGCTAYSRANCATVFSPTRASNPTLALKAALCRFRFAFISLLFLIYSKPAKIETYLWSKNRGPAQRIAENPLEFNSNCIRRIVSPKTTLKTMESCTAGL